MKRKKKRILKATSTKEEVYIQFEGNIEAQNKGNKTLRSC
jgi:hypothetical protein